MSKHTGWICPKCGHVWSPSTTSCRECGPDSSGFGSGVTSFPATAPAAVPPSAVPPFRYPPSGGTEVSPYRFTFPGGTVTLKTPTAPTATVSMGKSSVDLPTEQAFQFLSGTHIEPSLHPLD